MTGVLGETQLFLLAGLAFFFLSGTVVTVGVRVMRAPIGRIEPVSRARLLTMLGVAPIVLAIAGVLACVTPSALAHATGSVDHCGHHDDGHPHMCPWHAPHDAGSALGWIVGGLALGWLLARASTEAARLGRGVAAVGGLGAGADDLEGARLIDSDAAFSAAVGLLHPVVVISRGLRDRLKPEETDAVLAHERAHVERRDALRLVVVRAVLCAFPRTLTEPLEAELAVACEEACDAHAAAQVDDPLVVAEAIIKAARGARGHAPLLAMAAVPFGPHATDRRVRALCDPSTRESPLGLGALLTVVALMFVLAAPLHHVTETLLGALAH